VRGVVEEEEDLSLGSNSLIISLARPSESERTLPKATPSYPDTLVCDHEMRRRQNGEVLLVERNVNL
jgi:hypothetical protein